MLVMSLCIVIAFVFVLFVLQRYSIYLVWQSYNVQIFLN